MISINRVDRFDVNLFKIDNKSLVTQWKHDPNPSYIRHSYDNQDVKRMSYAVSIQFMNPSRRKSVFLPTWNRLLEMLRISRM